MITGQRASPILVIDVLDMDSHSSTIKLMRPGHPSKKIETSLGHSDLQEYYERYHDGLENFKNELSMSVDLNLDFETLTRAFRALFTPGKVLFAQLFGASTGDVLKYLEVQVTTSRFEAAHAQARIIEMRAKTFKDFIPIECLVLSGSKPEVKGLQDVSEVASRILGFSFVVRRVVKGNRQSQKRELYNVPRLPLKYFRLSSLVGTKAELAFFEQYREHISLEGPWPPKDGAGSIEKDLVHYLSRPDVRFNQCGTAGTEKYPLDEVHHLSCHCYTDEDHSWGCSLELESGRPITLATMEELLGDEKYANCVKPARIEKPLIFFNACGSSEMSPAGMTSFPEFFLIQNQNCGFIGSETRVPDQFASEFCKQFYIHLLRGYGVGEAVFRARHKMLNRYNNPLGILYVSYADPYLKVTRAINTL